MCIYNSSRCTNVKTEDLRMAEKTIVEKAAEKVGYGLAMAEDVAGAVRNIGWCCRDHGFQCANACKEGTKKSGKEGSSKKCR